MRVEIPGQTAILLNDAHFLARGGQASVYAQEGLAYKIFDDLDQVPSLERLRALKRLRHEQILGPLEPLYDEQGALLGFSMKLLSEAWTLCELFPLSFRRTQGLSPAQALALVLQLRELLSFIHLQGALIVDLNEMNVLVKHSLDHLYLIDTDSWQLPGFPATALSESVRDRHSSSFDEGTDWFAFAVVSFQLLTGIHPYRGRHPRLRSLDERMEAQVSVFDPEVKLPPSCLPFSLIPDDWRCWYEQLFEEGLRSPPPGTQASASHHLPPMPPAIAAPQIELEVMARYPESILKVLQGPQACLVLTEGGLYLGDQQLSTAPSGAAVLGFDSQGAPLALERTQLYTPAPRSLPLKLSQVSGAEGALYGLCEDQLLALQIFKGAILPRRWARLLPRAARLWPGVALQAVGTSTWCWLLEARDVRGFSLPELRAHRLMEARAERGALMVLGFSKGRYDRLLFRSTRRGYDCEIQEDVAPEALEFVHLKSGVLVWRWEDQLILRSGRPGEAGERRFSLNQPLSLWSGASGLLGSQGEILYRMRLKQ